MRNSWNLKQNKVRNNLIRLGGIPEELLDEIMEPVVGMEAAKPQKLRLLRILKRQCSTISRSVTGIRHSSRLAETVMES